MSSGQNPIAEYVTGSNALRRKEPRAEVALPVRVWGMDTSGAPFVQSVNTHDVSLTGACIVGVSAQVARGELIGLQCGPEKARFRVIWVAQTDGAGCSLGLSCTDEEKCLWTPSLTHVEHTQNYSGKNDRRQHQRFQCNGSAQLGEAGKGLRMWGTITDISEGGCYLQTVSNMQVGTKLAVELSVDSHSFSATTEVRTSHPNIGMGMQFNSLTPENQKKLEELMEKLEAKAAAQVPASVRVLKQIQVLHNDLHALETMLRQDSKHSSAALEKLARAHAEITELLEDTGPPGLPK